MEEETPRSVPGPAASEKGDGSLFCPRQKRLPSPFFVFRKSQSAGTQPPDRTGGDLEDEYSLVIDAALGVDRPMRQTDGLGGSCDGLDDCRLLARSRRWRRDVDRFLEERPVERVRLVEERQEEKPAVMQQPFERVFATGNEAFDEHHVMSVAAFGADVRRLEKDP